MNRSIIVLTIWGMFWTWGTVRGAAVRSGFDSFALPKSDVAWSPATPLGFDLNFFGPVYSSLYVNTDGNVTFGGPLWIASPFALTSASGTAIIAPLFADVDTRGAGSAVVQYGPGTVDGRAAFGVNWIDVGYFFKHDDKLNSFQLVLIDRSDRHPGDADIEFNYDTVLWESGDWSNGTLGLGGFSARAGYSNGTGDPGTSYELSRLRRTRLLPRRQCHGPDLWQSQQPGRRPIRPEHQQRPSADHSGPGGPAAGGHRRRVCRPKA